MVCIGLATVVEKYHGTTFVGEHIYGAWWFSALWAVLTVVACAYMVQQRLYKRMAVMLLHLSFVVILAGYTKEMKDFINSNPGLQSRFSRYIEFPDYNADELHQIFQKLLTKFDYKITKDADAALRDFFAYQVAHKDANFGNARFVRNVFEHTLQRQAARLANEDDHTRENLSEITKEDLPIEG